MGHYPFGSVPEHLGRDELRASFTPLTPPPVAIVSCSVVSASSITSGPSSALRISRTSDDESPARRILAILGLLTPEARSLSPDDLELLANWCITTYRSLTLDLNSQQIWKSIIPREALRYPVLLDSILALSALQLAYYSEQDRVQQIKFLSASQIHWIQAHAGLPYEFSRPLERSNCTALFAQYNTQILFAFAFSQLLRSSASTSALDRLCQVFRQIRGPTKALIDVMDIVQEGEMASLVIPQVADPKMPSTSAVAILGLKRLNVGQEHPGLGARQTKMVCSQAIDQLDACLAYTTRSNDPGILGLSWIHRIPLEYLDLLQDRKPLALIILAHYCVVMYHLRKRWWMGDWGVWVLREICDLLGRDQLATINWAIDATSICVTYI